MTENFAERLRELPANLSNHLELTVAALLCGLVLSVPLAVAVAKRPRVRYPVLTLAGVIQTIPGLAMLALMVPLLAGTDGLGIGLGSFGFWPAMLALTLYSVLPILRNTVTGLLGVDPALIEAARGVGMTERQMLFKVELPLAAPVIIAGIRTATVWTVAIATLGTPVGQRCLGNYIFTGLQTRNWTMVMFGVVSAAGLAIVLDLLIGALEQAAAERRRALAWTAGAALAAVVAAGLVSPSIVRSASSPPSAPVAAAPERETAPRTAGAVRIGGKTFTEQYILMALLADLLEDAGLETSRAESLGSTVVFDALRNGDIDVYVDYTGTIWANHMERTDAGPPWRVLAEVSGWLASEHGIRCLGSLGFENAYALAMTGPRARALGVRSIGDLARHAPELRIGGDYEFFGRPEWAAIRDAYGLSFADRTSYDPTLMVDALAVGQVDVISAFSSDGRIAEHGLVLLEDPRHVIPPYDAILLLGPEVAGRAEVAAALAPLVSAIPVGEMQQANLMVDREREKRTPAEAAAWLRSRL